MLRLLLLALAISLAAPPAAAQEKPTPAASIYQELGLPSPSTLPLLPAEYMPDRISLREVQRDPKRYPVRAAVLSAVQVLEQTRDIVPPSTRLMQADFARPGHARSVRDLQDGPAIAIALLDEAKRSLAAAEARRPKELSRRWQVHFDFVAAEIEFRIALYSEYNEMLAMIRRDDMPGLNPQAREVAWRLVPSETMKSKTPIRKLAESAREKFRTIAETDPNTPWAILAERYQASLPGLRWLPTTDLIDP